MDIKYALLGFLDWQPATGYELKKLITDTIGFEWSGNNNQVYTQLVQLHKKGLVTSQVQAQDRYPDRKIYSITSAGQEALREWVMTDPEEPQIKKGILVQLAWADRLTDEQLLDLLRRYEADLQARILMTEERISRKKVDPARTGREKYLWERMRQNCLNNYTTELEWTKQTITGLETAGYKGGK